MSCASYMVTALVRWFKDALRLIVTIKNKISNRNVVDFKFIIIQ